jgi:VWFA-related protein
MGRTVFASVGSAGRTSICANDALKLSARALSFIVQGLGELPGRKSMVVFSDSMPLDVRDLETVDGLTEGSIDKPVTPDPLNPSTDVANQFNIGAALKKLAELAIRSSVVIYGVDTRGVQPTGVTAADNFNAQRTVADLAGLEHSVSSGRSHQMLDLRAGAEMVAKETGGFLVRNSNDFQLQRVMSDQEGYYLIGYRPTSETFNRRFHHIKARVKRPGLSVRTREGFFGVTDEAARRPVRTNRDRMNLALVSPFASADIDVRLTTLFGNTAVNGSQLHSLLYFQARDLTFIQEADGWHQAVFDLSGIIFGDNGTIAHQTSETRTLRLRSEAYEQVMRDGLVYRLDLPVPKPGSYQFRVAVRDASSSRMGTAGQFVDVPNLNDGRLVLSGITVSDFAESGASQPASKPESAQQTAGNRPSMSGPAQRRFRTPSNLFFGYVIHNAQVDKATQQPKLVSSMRILRDGKVIFEGQEKAVDLSSQTDLKRITAGGGLQLGTDMAAGEYVLQITVTDLLAGEKHKTTTQWIDFEIVK